jgi:hypothetical protein
MHYRILLMDIIEHLFRALAVRLSEVCLQTGYIHREKKIGESGYVFSGRECSRLSRQNITGNLMVAVTLFVLPSITDSRVTLRVGYINHSWLMDLWRRHVDQYLHCYTVYLLRRDVIRVVRV